VRRSGFTLIELTVTIGIIGLLAMFVIANSLFARDKARDTKRIADLSQMGRFLTFSCPKPDGGVTSIDLVDFANELVIKFPQYSGALGNVPKDPSTGSAMQSNYTYIVTPGGGSCALFANLEVEDTDVTLTQLNDPTPGGGQGVLQGSANGVNGTSLYYQYSN
jgi:prepilin-type N-terminal cleavage/methylation domain-containing protein